MVPRLGFDMREHRGRAVTAAVLLILLIGVTLGLAACGEDESSAKQVTEKDFDAQNFPDQPKVDNRYNPLVPGTQYVMEGRSNRGQGRQPHQVIFTVTDLTKVINGVRTVVLWDQDINDGKLLEAELAFHAQDKDGNVWNMGEYPEEYDEEGEFDGAPDTWISGLGDAQAGVLMRADPRTGTSSYHQGLVPTIGFADRAKVFKTGQRNCVPVGCYDDVLITDETNPLEPNDGHQLKYYAPGVGNIRAAPGRGGKEREVLVLAKINRLSASELAKVRAKALKLDRRAYKTKPKLYGRTPPIERATATSSAESSTKRSY